MQPKHYSPSTMGRFPRTLAEAFGPYETGPIAGPKPTGYGWPWWAITLACGLAAAAITAWA